MITQKLKDSWVGRRYDKLVVLEVLPDRKALCRCDCGGTTEVYRNNLGRGNTTSCGCVWYKEVAQGKKHGHAPSSGNSRTYRIWVNMKTRCRNPRADNYAYYGGRGIDFCERWEAFVNFYEDMGDPPTEIHTLDRINNEGDYCLDNCRWLTMKEQCSNRAPKGTRIHK